MDYYYPAAAESGWQEGYDEGYDRGRDHGHEQGYDEGYSAGWHNGMKSAVRMTETALSLLREKQKDGPDGSDA